MSALPPKPWRVELVGLTDSVVFRHPDGRSLIWVDGEWWIEFRKGRMTARGVPAATTRSEARSVGAEWLRTFEQGTNP